MLSYYWSLSVAVIDCHTQSADYGGVDKCTEAQLLWKFLYNFEMSRPKEQLNFLINLCLDVKNRIM